MKRKRRFFFLILGCIFIVCFYLSKDALLLNTISKLVHIKDMLGKLYIERLDFDVAEEHEQIMKGDTEKCVLKDNLDNLWLFKVPDDIEDEIDTLAVYKLANILGVDTPEMYIFCPSINGKKQQGFLQRMLPSNSFFLTLIEFEKYKNDWVSVMLINELFSFLVGYEYDDVELLIVPPGKIYQIDLDNSFGFGKDDNEEYEKEEFWYKVHLYRKHFDIDFKQSYIFLNHIKSIKDDWLIKYVKAVLDEYPSQAYISNLIKVLIDRKPHLDDFYQLYSHHDNFASSKSTSCFLYRIDICRKLCKNILQKCVSSLFLKRKNKKNEFSLVSSGDTFRYLIDYFEFLRKPADFRKQEVPKLFLDAEDTLISICHKCNDFREKIAITLYMRQVRTLKQYIMDKHNNFCNESEILVPILYNAHSIRDSSFIDKWFSFIKYQTKGTVPPVKIKGEDEYIIGLAKLIHKQYDEAIKFLLIAQEEGYAPDETSNTLSSLF
nr:hypothetical protein [Nanoarchaeum sp.]